MSLFITGGIWNNGKLKDHVSAKNILDIISFHLSFTNATGSLVWHYNSKDNYFLLFCCNVAAHWVAKQTILKILSSNWVFDLLFDYGLLWEVIHVLDALWVGFPNYVLVKKIKSIILSSTHITEDGSKASLTASN